MKTTNTIRFITTIPTRHHTELTKIANKEDTSIARIIRRAIRIYLEEANTNG